MATTHIPARSGWIPRHDVMKKWYEAQLKKIANKDALRPWNDVITEFNDLIEGDPEIYMGFNLMFEETKNQYDPSHQEQIKTTTDMLNLFNEFLYQAPDYATQKTWGGLIAFPFNVVINWPMATPAGVALFTSPKVNAMLKKMFDVWAVFLTGKKSREVLNTKDGWLGPESLQELAVAPYDRPDESDPNKRVRFADAYICDTTAPYYGFKSWDDFFVRDFKDGIRPVESPGDNGIIVSACESDIYRIAVDVKQKDTFWLKEQPYSLFHMLNKDPDYGTMFEGGTVYQAFLSARSYHRWHSPVSGTVKKIVFVPGTYYAACPTADRDPAATDKSQPYITQMATRVLIFIDADDARIGTMCFIAVGMSEVSTCQVTIQDNDRVEKGDETGMFHFGGSTHCLVFRKETKLKFVFNNGQLPYNPDPDHQPHACLNRKIAEVL